MTGLPSWLLVVASRSLRLSVSEFFLEALHVSFDPLPPRFQLLPERVLGRLLAILDEDRDDLLGSFDVDRRGLRFPTLGLGCRPVDELRPEIIFDAKEIGAGPFGNRLLCVGRRADRDSDCDQEDKLNRLHLMFSREEKCQTRSLTIIKTTGSRDQGERLWARCTDWRAIAICYEKTWPSSSQPSTG